MSIPKEQKKQLFTDKQGQYLAFIYYYNKINGVPPAQKDLERFFNVTPPTVHSMIILLEKKNLLSRKPNSSRSIQISITPDLLPELI